MNSTEVTFCEMFVQLLKTLSLSLLSAQLSSAAELRASCNYIESCILMFAINKSLYFIMDLKTSRGDKRRQSRRGTQAGTQRPQTKQSVRR